MKSVSRHRGIQAGQRGAVLIGVLFFILIMSMLLIGAGTLAVGHQNLADTDLKYAEAMDVAEAGVNYELNKISVNPANADQYPGTSYDYGQGKYKVWCTNKDGTTPWNATQYLYVYATGTVGGTSRTVKISVKGFKPLGNYAIYTMDSISVWKGASATINGDVGTDGDFEFSANPTINGGIYFNGPTAGWFGTPPTGYNVSYEPARITWPTVEQVAETTFNQPAGQGLTWVAAHNDNARAVPPIVGNSVTAGVTLTAGNYYLENIDLGGNASNVINFDDSAGPVNVWIGPPGGTSPKLNFRGNGGQTNGTLDPTKTNHIYVSSTTPLDLGGGGSVPANLAGLIYAYNVDSTGHEYGTVQNSGQPTIYGQIIADTYNLNGNITLNYVTDLIQPTSFGYYGYDNSWEEQNSRY